MCFCLKATRFGLDIDNHQAKNIKSYRKKCITQTIIMFYIVTHMSTIYLFYNKIEKFWNKYCKTVWDRTKYDDIFYFFPPVLLLFVFFSLMTLDILTDTTQLLNKNTFVLEYLIFFERISSLHRAFRKITSTINQQMRLYNFHLKHFKILKTTPTYFDLFRSSSGSFVIPC